ncbi:hypothetical protein [Crystallibacter degradans]|uniref:hypothetical protein n=1 Tax=Crystallibacter degradans TaxID=2726743 RepID=UPI0014742D54|nr:hypothetical protein [Arthrobacter sp. SF27]NMR29940.1 hypothetical protein [Arthrobacter sp. SF27]
MDDSRRCTSKAKQSGERCKRAAIIGGTVCKIHGGGAGQVIAAAERNRELEAARRELSALGEPEDIDPAQALLRLISWKYGEVQWLRAQVRDLPADDLAWGRTEHRAGTGPEGPVDLHTEKASPSVWWTLLREAEDQLADYSTRALKAGIAERQIQIAEGQAMLVAGVIRSIYARLNLTPEQHAIKDQIARDEFMKLSQGPVMA